jgi:hypothetical protein
MWRQQRRPALGASQHHPNTQESNRCLQQKLSNRILNQRTVSVRVSKPLFDILGKLVPKKGGQKKGLTKGDMQILALLAEAGYEVDTKAWTLVIAPKYQNYQNYYYVNCTEQGRLSPTPAPHARVCRMLVKLLSALLIWMEPFVSRLEETLRLKQKMVP